MPHFDFSYHLNHFKWILKHSVNAYLSFFPSIAACLVTHQPSANYVPGAWHKDRKQTEFGEPCLCALSRPDRITSLQLKASRRVQLLQLSVAKHSSVQLHEGRQHPRSGHKCFPLWVPNINGRPARMWRGFLQPVYLLSARRLCRNGVKLWVSSRTSGLEKVNGFDVIWQLCADERCSTKPQNPFETQHLHTLRVIQPFPGI